MMYTKVKRTKSQIAQLTHKNTVTASILEQRDAGVTTYVSTRRSDGEGGGTHKTRGLTKNTLWSAVCSVTRNLR
jgi:hypothetical protein